MVARAWASPDVLGVVTVWGQLLREEEAIFSNYVGNHTCSPGLPRARTDGWAFRKKVGETKARVTHSSYSSAPAAWLGLEPANSSQAEGS